MRRLPIAVALVALIVVAALGLTTGSTASPRALPSSGVAAVTSATLVCPDITGAPPGAKTNAVVADVAGALSPPSTSAGTVTQTTLGGSTSKPAAIEPHPAAVLPSVAKSSRSVEVSATGSVAASLAADQLTETPTGRFRALSGVRCESPATDWWFTGADGRVGFADVLMLANPAPTAAEVGISLWSDKGPLVNARLESIRLGPHATTRVPIASAAPDSATVAVHVHAISGAVTAAMSDNRSSALTSEGGDFIPPTTAPGKAATVAGFPPGRGPRYLILTAPGTLDATVRLRMVTKSGSFTPTGIDQVVVRAGHSRVVPIATPLAGSTGAVELSSDQPIIAAGIAVTVEAGQRPDISWVAATPAVSGPAAIADGREPDGGHTFLYLSAPDGTARVRVSSPTGHSTTVVVPARTSIVSDITTTIREPSGPWPFVVTPVGSAPVYGVRAMYFPGAHGALITAEPLIALPRPIHLPPVREDPSVAVR